MYELSKQDYINDFTKNNSICDKLITRTFPSSIINTRVNTVIETETDTDSDTDSNTNNHEYTLMYYNKSVMDTTDYDSFGLARSLIFDSNKHVCCFSPPKAIDFHAFTEKYPKDDMIVLEEMVEGTMVNLFWDPRNKVWEFSTRRNIGARNGFMVPGKEEDNRNEKNTSKQQKTFRDMFIDATQYSNFDFLQLNRGYCYSFVLQHPANRIVNKINTPALYLVAMYEITKDMNVISHDLSIVKNDSEWKSTGVKFPEIYAYPWDSYEEPKTWFGGEKTPIHMVGVMIHNRNNGMRCKIRNPNYERVRKMRSNQSNIRFNYLLLRQSNQVAEYLNYYPEDNAGFRSMQKSIHEFTAELYKQYISCFIKKEKPLIEFSSYFRTHMFHLHRKYLDDLKPNDLVINKGVVIQYVNNLEPKLVMHSLRYVVNADNTNNEPSVEIEA